MTHALSVSDDDAERGVLAVFDELPEGGKAEEAVVVVTRYRLYRKVDDLYAGRSVKSWQEPFW